MTITNQDIDAAIRTSNTGTAADSPIRALTNALLKALNAELQSTQQDLLNKVDTSVFNALAQVARSGSFTDLSGAPQSYGATGQNTDGFMTQKATTDALAAKADLEGGKVKLEQLPSSLVSGVIFKGLWDADANKDNQNAALPGTPGNDGDYYIVSVAGTQFGFTFAAGDWLIADNGAWAHLEPDNLVASVNGQTGVVTIDVGVTSIGVNVPTGLTVSGVPITSTGVIEIALASGYVIPTVEQLQAIGGIDAPEGWQEAGNEDKYLAGDGTLKNLPSDTQSDWAQANSNAPDFIKNKPQLFNGDYDSLTNQPDIPSKTSELQNDSAFVTSASLQGLIPKPQDWGDGDKFLAGDGTLKEVQGGSTGNPSVTGTFSAFATTNVIYMKQGANDVNLRDALDLEIGDVIKISGSADGLNDKYHTVEAVDLDAPYGSDGIIVNYEHCGSRGAGSLMLTLESSTPNVTIERFKKWHEAPLGLGQAWVMLNNVRSNNTNYTNNTNRLLHLSCYTQSTGNSIIRVDGVPACYKSASATMSIVAQVPLGSAYKVENVRDASPIAGWVELR